LTRIVLWWSFFTAATGWVWNLPSLLITRLLFGAGEAGCFPGLAKSFSAWLPADERPMAEGIKATSARWGAAFTPYLIVSVYRFLTWRPEVNQAELALLRCGTDHRLPWSVGGAPWRKFLTSRSAWALCVQWFCHYYG